MEAAIFPGADAERVFGASRQDEGDASWTPKPGVLRALKIPPLVLLITVLVLAGGELASGTGLYFVSMMVIALTSIGITYNMLGGLSRIGGFFFAAMAAQRIVISQFAKVIFFEPADRNLLVPNLTITVYAVFFLSGMVGVFLFAGNRLRLPRPWEPTTGSQTRLLYFVSLIVGLFATAIFNVDNFGTTVQTNSLGHGFGLLFSYLLLLSIVLAVDDRIRRSGGKHSVGIWVVIPSVASMFFAYLLTSRSGEITPIVIYFLSCYVRGYRFRRKHYIAGFICIVLFQTVISPFALYSRDLMSGLSFRERVSKGYELLRSRPNWMTLQDTQEMVQRNSEKDEYYSVPGTFVLSRLSLIRADSDLIGACSNGFHYGFKPLKMYVLANIPRILYRNKPDGAADNLYIEGVIGEDRTVSGHWSYTSISDSYGAFGWIGVVVFPLFVLPAVFAVYDSMFDMTRPWGTVALASLAVAGGVPMGGTLTLLLKVPLYLWILSMLTVGISRFVTASGKQVSSLPQSRNRESIGTGSPYPAASNLWPRGPSR